VASLKEIERTLKKHKQELRKQYRIKDLGIFGSYVRGEQKKRSDVDILVEFETGQKTFDHFMDLKYHLEELLGRKVDLVTVDALRPQMKDEILRDVTYA
jgi:predicted nucleotidyltransferase